MTFFQYVFNELGNFLSKNGTAATPEHTKARKAVCKGCDKYGVVTPLPKIKAVGCTQCKCVLDIKAAMLTVERAAMENIGKPITPEEAVKVKLLLKTNRKTYTELITCPHPEGSKWTDIDKQHLK